MEENEKFLNKNAKDVYEEVIGLGNDAIDILRIIIEKFKTGEEAIKHPMAFFAVHVLMPISYGIYVDLLIGNLPACFMELRLMHETMAKCYLAEKMGQDQEFFGTSLEALEKRYTSTSKLMEELGSDFVKLWGKLSENWAHPRGISRGILKHIVDRVVERGIPPSWSIILPTTYTNDDLDDLKELRKRVAEFRKLLKIVTSELYSPTQNP
ncbi:MAG TPA: hypothetical protein HA300_03165 [Thermococcaceae archaeon]|nr:hypothetical protein [Thermococcaceae archaeon]